MEAMQQGAVPVIASGPITGADQFALDERSRFRQRDAHELARKIDAWLDSPQELEAARSRYVREMEEYAIQRSVEKLIQMFEDALNA